MNILISSLDDVEFTDDMKVRDISYSKSDLQFTMPIVMGDDWFQRLKSNFAFHPLVVRFDKNTMFVVFENSSQCKEFKHWLEVSEEAVSEGFRTMRG